jgi:hypothetical protein
MRGSIVVCVCVYTFQLHQGFASGMLFGLFFAAASPNAEAVLAQVDAADKLIGMCWAAFGENPVLRGSFAAGLEVLQQQALVVGVLQEMFLLGDGK